MSHKHPGKFFDQQHQFAVGKDKLIAHLAMLLFAILISGSFSFGHLAAPHIAPTALSAVRFIFATAIIGVAILVLKRAPPDLPRSPSRIVILGALMATYFVLMFVALRITDPVSTGAVFTLIPFMSAAFGWMFLQQITNFKLLGALLLAALGSIWMIFHGDINALMRFDVGQGELIFLVGCACHAAYAPLVKKFNTDLPVIEFTFWTLLATTMCILVAGWSDILATQWFQLPGVVWGAIAYLSIFTTAITFFLVQFSSMRLPASKVLSYGYLTPGFIIVIEGVLGHGWASLSVWIGAILTIVGLLLIARTPDR